MIDAVVFDLGGVVFESPLEVIAMYEEDHGIATGTINRAVVDSGTSGAWARYERGEIAYGEFRVRFMEECAVAGGEVNVDALMAQIEEATVPRPSMLETIAAVRETGRLVAALTNNWTPLGASGFTDRFDVVVESSVEGVRKPQPRIYELVLERLGIDATSALFLDDIGANLKPARAMGMATIKVVTVEAAIADMWRVLGDD